MEDTWIVLLEAVGDESRPPIDFHGLGELMEAMRCDQIVGLQNPHRYAVQLRLPAASPAEALFAATCRWRAAVRQIGFDDWSLQRSEVLTEQEFERDWALSATEPAAASGGEGDDLLQSAFFDGLTGFPTLSLFRDRAQRIIAACASSGHPAALLVVDVDRFAAINAQFGYSVGDRVLVEVTGRLSRWPDSTWAVARLVNDQFVLLIDDEVGMAAQVVSEMVKAVRTPLAIDGYTITLTVSIGAVSVDTTADLNEQLDRAGMAMAFAKEAGGDRYQWWEPSLRAAGGGLAFPTQQGVNRLAYVLLLQRAALAANECSSLEEASAMVVQQVLAHTGWRAGHLWTVDEASRTLQPSDVWRVSGPNPLTEMRRQADEDPASPEQDPAATVARTAQPMWMPVTPGSGREAAIGAGLAAVAAFPILAGAEVVGVLEFFCTSPASPDTSLLDVMAAIGTQLGRIVERRRAAEMIARSEDRYRMLAESLPSLMWEADPEGRTTLNSQAWLDLTGRTAKEDEDVAWLDDVHPDDRTDCDRTYREACTTQEPFEMELRVRSADGQYRWLLSRGSPVSRGGVFSGFIGSCVDVTDLRLAQVQLREETTRVRALINDAELPLTAGGPSGAGSREQGISAWEELATALVGAVTPLEVASALAVSAARAAGASFSNMALFDRAANMVHVVHHPDLYASVAKRWTAFPIEEPTPLCEAILTGKQVLLASPEAITHRYPNLRQDTMSASLASTASIPLRSHDGTTLAALGFAWEQPQRFRPADIRRLETIADLAAGALERAMLIAARSISDG